MNLPIKNIPFEVVRCPATIWCGTLGYASNCTDEPDIGALLKKYQKYVIFRKWKSQIQNGHAQLALTIGKRELLHVE